MAILIVELLLFLTFACLFYQCCVKRACRHRNQQRGGGGGGNVSSARTDDATAGRIRASDLGRVDASTNSTSVFSPSSRTANNNSNNNNTATTSSPSSNLSRTELIKKNLFHRRIAREDSVRELSRLLAISRGNAAEDDIEEWESFPDEETGTSTPSSKDKRGNNRSTSTSSLPAPSAPLSPMSNVTEDTDRSSVAMGCEDDDDVNTGGGDRDKRNVELPLGGMVRTFWWGRSQQNGAEAASAEPPKTSPRSQRHRPECSICLEYFSPNDAIAWAKDGGDNTGSSGYYSNNNNANQACDHIFHEACLVAWLQHHDECPLCRRKVVHEDAEIRFAGWEGR